MARFKEPLTGGLVTAKLPEEMSPGELQRCDNLVYVPGSPAPRTTPSRTYDTGSTYIGTTNSLAFCSFDFTTLVCDVDTESVNVTVTSGSTDGISVGAAIYGDALAPGTTVTGLGTDGDGYSIIHLSAYPIRTGLYILHAQADNYLVTSTGGYYSHAQIADAGGPLTFESGRAITGGETLQAIHYANEYVLLNGADDNVVFKANRTYRNHGMKPVVTTPTVSVQSGGTWTLDSGTGIYSYWTTEVDKSYLIKGPDGAVISEGLESTFEGQPAVANVSAADRKVVIKRPERVNDNATHWRLYRSFKMSSTSLDKAAQEHIFPDGYFVAEAPMVDDGTSETITDGETTPSSVVDKLPTSIILNSSTGGVTWSNPTYVFAADASFATLARGTLATGSLTTLRVGEFGIDTSAITPPIVGIVIKVKGKATGTSALVPAGIRVKPVILRNNFPTNIEGYGISGKLVNLTSTNTEYTLPTDGVTTITTDTWGLSNLSPSDFSDSKFAVDLIVGGLAFANTANTFSDQVIHIDSIKVTVYSNQGKLVTEELFPAIDITSFGLRTAMGRNGPPPVASTGDIFQDSLVLNDISDQSIVKYSYPTRVDYFPRPYYLNFETKEQDKINVIKTLGNVCLVGLRSQIYRINYLPRETDAEFDRGRAVELVEASHGIVGTEAACYISFPNEPQTLAYVSRFGIHMTDGYRTRNLCLDLNWSKLGIVSPEMIKLVDNPLLQHLEMYYSTDGVANNRVLFFSYHPLHLKGGYLKVSGPMEYTSYGVTTGYPSGSTGSSGYVKLYSVSSPGYVEEEQSYENQWAYPSGRVNNSTYLDPVIKTRRMNPAGAGNEWRVKEVYTAYTGSEYRDGGTEGEPPSPLTFHADVYRTGVEVLTTDDVSVSTRSAEAGATDKVIIDATGEGIELMGELTRSHQNPVSLDYLVVEGEGFGREESG